MSLRPTPEPPDRSLNDRSEAELLPADPSCEVRDPGPTKSVSRRGRLVALGLVLSVSFAHFIVSSLSQVLGADQPSNAHQMPFRLLGMIVSEATPLFLLWYVLWQQGRTWKDIGWKPAWMDIIRGVALTLVGSIVAVLATATFQDSYRSLTGHYLRSNQIQTAVTFGISPLSVIITLLNPFFEELIVRGYAMSELMDLGFDRTLVIFISVAMQVSYHLYQGLARVISVTAVFFVFSVFFSRTRKIGPVVLAHFCFDAYALIRYSL